jgi:hypothetical protein
MIAKGAKPRTHLVIDVVLFSLLLGMVTSILLAHVVPGESHASFMLHALHGVMGILFFLVISLHLILHFRWIKAQVIRLFK